MKSHTIDVVSLGCSKNLVDSERLIRQLELQGFRVCHESRRPQGEIAVVNTCGFIADAKEESINTILAFCRAKREGRLRKLFVMGCLSERYGEELARELPEVDKIYGKFNWKALLSDLGKAYDAAHEDARRLTTPSHYAYLKISEGCDRHCAFCAIPGITGPHRSRPMERIVAEARALATQGVKELNVIAQELTSYGKDLYGRAAIAELVERLADVEGIAWIRLHYAYPAGFPTDLLRVMRERENVCNYLDIALQHISDLVLRNMRRHITGAETRALIRRMREEVPGLHLRTTLMVGFPGEGEEEFAELVDFVRETRFERMGAFAYCEEDGTWGASHLTDSVPADEKQRRLDTLMRVQETIAGEVSAAKVGQTLRVIIDRREGDYYVGRTEWDSPEVDGEVLVPVAEGRLRRGQFYDLRITGADEFDLYGTKATARSPKHGPSLRG